MNDLFKYLKDNFQISKKEVFAFFVIVVFIFSLPALLTQIKVGIVDFSDSGPVGDTIGGITTPFISLLGSILVYLAFKEQIKANKKIEDQFQEQLLFRLMENLELKIVNYSIVGEKNVELKSYDLIQFINRELLQEMENQQALFGRHLLSKNSNMIDNMYFERMLEIDPNNKVTFNIKNGIELKETIIKLSDNERWEFLKLFFNSVGYELEKQSEVLESIARVYWYKSPFKIRQSNYSISYYEIFKKYGIFLSTYFSSLEYILETLVQLKKEKKEYHIYFNSQLSSVIKSIIFYYIASGQASKQMVKSIMDLELLKDLQNYNFYFLDVPGEEEFKKELLDIYDLYNY